MVGLSKAIQVDVKPSSVDTNAVGIGQALVHHGLRRRHFVPVALTIVVERLQPENEIGSKEKVVLALLAQRRDKS